MINRQITLDKFQELRVQVDEKKSVKIALKKGDAEIYGAQLGIGETVTLTGKKIAIFSYTGCVLEAEGNADVMEESYNMTMKNYLNTHYLLNKQRNKAKESNNNNNNMEGPRVIIVGETDSGKSTLCTILLNYAVRMEWIPTYVDLDIGQGNVTAPGTISAVPLQLPVTVEDGYPLDIPLVYFYGHISPTDNSTYYKFLVERMATILNKRSKMHSKLRHSGMIINTMGWVKNFGYTLILHAIKYLKADYVLVMHDAKLHRQLEIDLNVTGGTPISVVRLPKSEGVVSRPQEMRKLSRALRIKDYFYGLSRNLMPHLQQCPISELTILRIPKKVNQFMHNSEMNANIIRDKNDNFEGMRFLPVKVTNEIFNCILAVSHAQTIEEVPNTSISGFIYVQSINTSNENEGEDSVTFLAPSPGKLPGKFLLLGSIEILNMTSELL